MKNHMFTVSLTVLVAVFLVAEPAPTVQRGINVVSPKGQDVYLYKDYHALVIGISDYDYWPDLPNAAQDAEEVAAKLKGLGFAVNLLLNPTSEEMKNALGEIVYKTGQEENRAILLYFAGHGETERLADKTDMGYIIPKDCPILKTDPLGFSNRALSMRYIESVSLRIKSKHVLMLFDSCFSGSLFNLVRAMPQDITEKSASPVRQYITAGRGDEQVPDRSMFKRCLLIGLEGDADLTGDGYITGTELGVYLAEKVVNYTRSRQHPQYGKINNPDLDRGDFIFVPLKNTQKVAVKEKTSTDRNPSHSKPPAQTSLAKINRPDYPADDPTSQPRQRQAQLGKARLAIFPWKLSLSNYHPPGIFYTSSFRALLDAIEKYPDMSLKYSYYRHRRLAVADVVPIDDILPKDKDVFWSKPSFFARPEPDLDSVVEYGDKVRADLVILYNIEMRGDNTKNYLYIIDIHKHRIYHEKFVSTGTSEEKIRAAAEKLLAAVQSKARQKVEMEEKPPPSRKPAETTSAGIHSPNYSEDDATPDPRQSKDRTAITKLAIFPWKVILNMWWSPGAFYSESFRAILDAVETNPDMTLEYSSYRHQKFQIANVVPIDDVVPTDEDEFWFKPSFFADYEPNLDTVVEYGNKIKADLVILYYVDKKRANSKHVLYAVDIHQKRIYQENFSSTEATGSGEDKLKLAAENIFAALKN